MEQILTIGILDFIELIHPSEIEQGAEFLTDFKTYEKIAYMTKIILLFTCIFSIISCKNNSMYFDIYKSEFSSCDEIGINKLVVKNLKNFDLFILKSKNYNSTSNFSIYEIEDLFSIESNQESSIFSLSKPNTLFSVINTSNGDASHFEVLILTDSLGFVSETSRPSCETYNHSLEIIKLK